MLLEDGGRGVHQQFRHHPQKQHHQRNQHGLHRPTVPASLLTRRLKLLLDVAYGMKYLHEKSTTHRDLKSANILVFADGTAKVADFGRSKKEEISISATAKGGFVGTYTHAAPETLESNAFSPASDVYAFGVIAWEVLTGLKPWDGMSLMHDCWAQEPTDRPQFADVVRRLERMRGKADETRGPKGLHTPN